jgi:hypothetical protein
MASFVLLQWRTDNQSLAKHIWNFGMKKKSEKRLSRKDAKHVLSDVEGAAKLTGRGPSSRANATDLRKISPFGRNDNESYFACLASLRRSLS